MEKKKRKRKDGDPVLVKQHGLFGLGPDLYFVVSGFLPPRSASHLREVFGNRFSVDWKTQTKNAWTRRRYWYEQCKNKNQLNRDLKKTERRSRKELLDTGAELDTKIEELRQEEIHNIKLGHQVHELEAKLSSVMEEKEELRLRHETLRLKLQAIEMAATLTPTSTSTTPTLVLDPTLASNLTPTTTPTSLITPTQTTNINNQHKRH